MPRYIFFVGAGIMLCSIIHRLVQTISLTNPRRGLAASNDMTYLDGPGFFPEVVPAVSNELMKATKIQDTSPRKVKHHNIAPKWWSPCELKDKDANETDLEPTSYILSNYSAILLLPGKSGGGTFTERAVQCWRTFVSTCHPRPCLKKVKHEKKAVIITIRDPIDRFVSAFYWRLVMVCDFNDDRKRKRGATKDPERFCKKSLPGELRALRYYQKDASNLAESLCSKDTREQRRAAKSIQTIEHARSNLQQWLNFSWNAQDLFPVVTEPGASDLERETDAALQWLYNRNKFESQVDFESRSQYAENRRVSGDLLHSSSHRKKRLTPEAERCLAQYYRKDYEVLEKIRRSACKTDGCHRGLNSILRRRGPLLDTIA